MVDENFIVLVERIKNVMATIYLPSNYSSNCNVVYNNYVRSFTDNTYTSWVDIYVHQDYMESAGSSTDPQSVVCDTLNTYTDNIYYKLGYRSELFSMFILAFLFALFLLQIRRFAKYDFA